MRVIGAAEKKHDPVLRTEWNRIWPISDKFVRNEKCEIMILLNMESNC